TSVAVTYTGAQSAGNLNVVIVGWNSTSATVSSVTDTAGNTYTLAVGPTVYQDGGLSQAIYYAKNIASAGAGNAVTVRFSAAAPSPGAPPPRAQLPAPNPPLRRPRRCLRQQRHQQQRHRDHHLRQ